MPPSNIAIPSSDIISSRTSKKSRRRRGLHDSSSSHISQTRTRLGGAWPIRTAYARGPVVTSQQGQPSTVRTVASAATVFWVHDRSRKGWAELHRSERHTLNSGPGLGGVWPVVMSQQSQSSTVAWTAASAATSRYRALPGRDPLKPGGADDWHGDPTDCAAGFDAFRRLAGSWSLQIALRRRRVDLHRPDQVFRISRRRTFKARQ